MAYANTLRRVSNSSIFRKMSTALRQANEKPEPTGFWLAFSSRKLTCVDSGGFMETLMVFNA